MQGIVQGVGIKTDVPEALRGLWRKRAECDLREKGQVKFVGRASVLMTAFGSWRREKAPKWLSTFIWEFSGGKSDWIFPKN